MWTVQPLATLSAGDAASPGPVISATTAFNVLMMLSQLPALLSSQPRRLLLEPYG